MVETINKLLRVSRLLVQELGREPRPRRSARAWSSRPTRSGASCSISAASRSRSRRPVGEDEDSHLGDFIEDENALAPVEAVIALNLQRPDAAACSSTLTPREEQVLRLRFGIGERSDHTLEEVGARFAVTRERIRQIEAKALRKLRHPSRARCSGLFRGLSDTPARRCRSPLQHEPFGGSLAPAAGP